MELVQSGVAYVSYLVMSNELNTPKLMICPEDNNPRRVTATSFVQPSAGVPSYGVAFTNNCNVSYFVGVDANIARPARLIVGDANFTANNTSLSAGMVWLRTNDLVAWGKDMHHQKAKAALINKGSNLR